jgi:hypothetical protein
MNKYYVCVAMFTTALAVSPVSASTLLYDQDFESPVNYVNDGGDINIFRTVNDLYGNQPPGFSFNQAFTSETLNITGSQRGGGSAAFGTGYSDPSGTGGNFAIGMLSDAENDLTSLVFNVGAFDFLNVGVDVSSIDLDRFGGPFIPAGGAAPTFRFTLFDNPGGTPGLGGGTVLDFADASAAASDRAVFAWTSSVLALSTAGNTDGNVILQIDLLTGAGYAAFDNIRIVASDEEGDLDPISLPASLPLFAAGLAALTAMRRRGG